MSVDGGLVQRIDDEVEATLRLLLVEDDEVDRETVRRAFARAGVRFARFDEATTAARALEAAVVTEYDCILLDYNIPGSDGLKVLRAVRSAGIDTPVIMLTGQGDEAVAVELMKAGAADYISKAAISPERLAHSLRYAVELARAAAMTRMMQAELRESAERTRYLAEASRQLADSLDVDTTTRAVARLSVPRLGECCIVYLLGDEGSPTIAAAHADPAKAELVQAFRDAFRPDEHPGTLAMAAMRTGQPQAVVDLPDSFLVAASRTPHELEVLRALAPTSVLALPLIARGQVIGATVFMRSTPAPFTPEDRLVAEDLVRRAATALDNARLFALSVDARRQAEEANRTKGEFLARMSHDLRTPLNAIGGYSQLLELGVHGPVNESQAQALGRIRRAQEHLLTLINDILSFAKLEAGQVQVTLGEHRVGAIVDELAGLVRPDAEQRGLVLETEYGPEDLYVSADRGRLMQILTNLTSNAVKFTEAGRVTIAARAAGEWVELRVADTGPGIPRDRLDAIFDPFVQARTAADTAKGGVGLGLAISRELTRLMRGELRVTSEEGRGSAFTVRLPRAVPAIPEAEPEQGTAGAAGAAHA